MTATEVVRFGFGGRGPIFRKIQNTNVGIIEFQKSVKNTSARLLFTVNLGVVCGELLEADLPNLEDARSSTAHLRQRIGMLLPGRPDKWWEITDSSDITVLAKDVSSLVVEEVVPYIQRYLNTDDLIALWDSGRSPGLTETQRTRNLAKLRSIRKSE